MSMALRPVQLGLLCAAALATACGGGPKLSNLRCREAQCQSPESPFVLRLQVDFEDASATMGTGALELRLAGKTQNAVALKDVFAAQGLDPKAVSGTLQIDQNLYLDQVTQGEELKTSFIAHDGEGSESNEPSLTFNLTVSGSP
ncbi:MAG: hypothetical protein JST92_25705 [Deltaproteobacteria bacterium]|nr:hypothetical protein [Deltaproteobacteria bacterium]